MIAKFEDVKDGNELWYVTVYKVQGQKRGFVEHLQIVGEVYQTNSGSIFCNCFRDYSSRVSEFSLKDANIIPNSYNEHMTFTTSEEAYSYIGKVLGRNEVSSSVVTNLRKENTDLKRVLRVILESTSPMKKVNAVHEARGLLAK